MYDRLFERGSAYCLCTVEPTSPSKKATMPYLLPLSIDQLHQIFYVSGIDLPRIAIITAAIWAELAKSPTLSIATTPMFINIVAGMCHLPRNEDTFREINSIIDTLKGMGILCPNPLFEGTICYPKGIENANSALAKRAKLSLKDAPADVATDTVPPSENTAAPAEPPPTTPPKKKKQTPDGEGEPKKKYTLKDIVDTNENIQTLLKVWENKPYARKQPFFFLRDEHQKYPLVHLAYLFRFFTLYISKENGLPLDKPTNHTPDETLGHLSNKYRSIYLADPNWWRDWESVFCKDILPPRPDFKNKFANAASIWHTMAIELNMPAGAAMYNKIMKEYIAHFKMQIPDVEILKYIPNSPQSPTLHIDIKGSSTPLQNKEIGDMLAALFGDGVHILTKQPRPTSVPSGV